MAFLVALLFRVVSTDSKGGMREEYTESIDAHMFYTINLRIQVHDNNPVCGVCPQSEGFLTR